MNNQREGKIPGQWRPHPCANQGRQVLLVVCPSQPGVNQAPHQPQEAKLSSRTSSWALPVATQLEHSCHVLICFCKTAMSLFETSNLCVSRGKCPGGSWSVTHVAVEVLQVWTARFAPHKLRTRGCRQLFYLICALFPIRLLPETSKPQHQPPGNTQ